MKTYRIILCIAIALLACIKTVAQQPDFLFEHLYPYQLNHTLFWEEDLNVVHLEVAPDGDMEEGCYLVAASDSKNPTYYESDSVVFPPMVYKVSLEGEILGELALGYEDRYSMIVRLFDDPHDAFCCFAIGVTHDNDVHYDRPFMAKFDHDLNLLWQREIELPEPYHENMLLSAIMDSSGDIVCCLAITGFNAVFCRLTMEGEIAAIRQYTGPCNSFINNSGNLFEFQDGSGDYGKVMESYSNTSNTRFLVRIDRNLELVSHLIIPSTIVDENSGVCRTIILFTDMVYTCIPVSDGSVVFGGGYGDLSREDFDFNWTYDDIVGFMRFDQDGQLVSYGMTGQGELGNGNDSIKAMIGSVCADIVGEDAFYFYHTVGAPGGWGYDWMNCFVVTKMDFDGNVIWQRYWDRYFLEYEMKVYYPNFLTTTSDDGCLISGYCYYSDIYGSQRFGSDPEIFMLKFFPDGTFSVPEVESFIRPYLFYPNPAQDHLHLQFSPDVQPKQIEFYDLQGRMVRSQGKGLESINLQGLSAGQYLMKVTLEDGKVFTDKVMKE